MPPSDDVNNSLSNEILTEIIAGRNIDMWIDEKVRVWAKDNDKNRKLEAEENSDFRKAIKTHADKECPGLNVYINNINKIKRQRKILEEYKKYISSDIKGYGTGDAENSKNLHQMKALYTSQYTILVKFWIKRFRIIYYLILVCYIGILVKNRKYKSKPHIAIAVILCAYPLMINHIMIALLKGMEYIFSYTPANAYRNLFSQNINKLEKDDIYLHYTQVPI